MPSIVLPAGPVHYKEVGHGDPVVLLHANPGDSDDFAPIIPELAAEYRVLALDWPGYGQSPPPAQLATASATGFYEVFRQFADAVALPPAVLVGNSVGGNVAARFAVEFPERVRGLVLVSPGGFTSHNTLTRMFCRLQASWLNVPPLWLAKRYLRERGPVVEQMLARAAGPQSGRAALAVNRSVWRSFLDPSHDLRPLAIQLRAPTLLCFGQYDPIIPANKDGRLAAQCLPHARVVVFNSGHAPFAEIPEAFLSELRPFLTSLKPVPA
jgi:pimeloyl-ACP methyl ester carboxylesterase